MEIVDMKKVMLLGDSIRMGYEDRVITNLGVEYEVWSPEENCRFARYTLNCLRNYIEECPNPDIIHWNNGLWDTAILYPEDGCFTPINEYIRDMKLILRELKKTGAEIIFATITPINPLKVENLVSKHSNEDIIEFNKHVVDVMKEENIIINDLHSLIYLKIHEYICEDHIHMTDEGKIACGKAVADIIKSVLE